MQSIERLADYVRNQLNFIKFLDIYEIINIQIWYYRYLHLISVELIPLVSLHGASSYLTLLRWDIS